MHTPEEVLIHNFEVKVKEEQQVAYASGVRGIRALRLQRDILKDDSDILEADMNASRNKFFQAE